MCPRTNHRASDDIDGYDDAPGYAGFESIFGLFPPGGCEACKYRPPFDVSVDITDALRTSNLRRDDAVLKVSQALTHSLLARRTLTCFTRP